MMKVSDIKAAINDGKIVVAVLDKQRRGRVTATVRGKGIVTEYGVFFSWDAIRVFDSPRDAYRFLTGNMAATAERSSVSHQLNS